jgi:hypothetical protein
MHVIWIAGVVKSELAWNHALVPHVLPEILLHKR